MNQPPPTKFWQAVCGFWEFKSVLAEVFGDARWQATYGQNYKRWDEIIRAQDRSILDSDLPVELTREIAARCTRLQYWVSEDGELRRVYPKWPAKPGATILSALQVHDRFGGAAIEEVEEKGSAIVKNHAA